MFKKQLLPFSTQPHNQSSISMKYSSPPPQNLYKALSAAIDGNDRAALEALLKDAGQDVKDYRNDYRGSLLHMAAEQGSVETTKYLIEQGCRVDERDLGDGTALVRASGNENPETQVEIVKLLLAAGANAEARAEGRTGLSFFLDGNHRESAALLIKRGANVNAKEDRHGFTMLHTAAARHNWANVYFLLDHGADPKINSNDKRSTLQFAIQSCGSSPMNYDVLRKLLELGADPNAKLNRGGTTVFHKMLQHADEAIVRLFIRNGARVGTVLKGKAVRDQAAKNKDPSVARLVSALQGSKKTDLKNV